MIIKQGALSGERVRYPDGTVGMCVWYPISDKPEDEDVGMCFDFNDKDATDLLHLVNKLIDTEPKILVDEPSKPEPKLTLSKRFYRRFINPIGWWLIAR